MVYPAHPNVGGTLRAASIVCGAGSGANTITLGGLAGGTVTVASGATLDIGANTTVNNANFGAKQLYIAGLGVGGTGAIVNHAGTNQQNAFQNITLMDDATIGGQNRWDLRNNSPVLDLAGHTLTKTGINQITVVAGTITGGAIEINQGLLSVETTCSFTGSGTSTVNAGSAMFSLNSEISFTEGNEANEVERVSGIRLTQWTHPRFKPGIL